MNSSYEENEIGGSDKTFAYGTDRDAAIGKAAPSD